MNKKIAIFSICTLFFVTGCTMPSQKVALTSMKRSMQVDDQIHDKLVDKAWVSSLNRAGAEVISAVESSDTGAATSAVEGLSDDLADIMWLHTQYERSRAMKRSVLQYIYEQQGILDLWWEDLKEAKDISDAKDAVTE